MRVPEFRSMELLLAHSYSMGLSVNSVLRSIIELCTSYGSLTWIALASDLAIAVAYFAIPVTMAIVLRQRKDDIPYPWLWVLFVVFIVACGMTHIVHVWAAASGVQYLEVQVIIGVITALASVGTAIAFAFVLPEIKNLPSPRRQRMLLEEMVAKRTAEKDRLIREINHRVGNQLQIMNSLVRLEKQSRAAERLLRNQSTVSLQLKRLEELVGQTLVTRSSRKLQLTRSGETFLTYAHRILSLNDEVMMRVNEPELAGTVRLGVPEDFATTYMPSILGEFSRSYPLVSLEVTCELTLRLMELFRADQFDLVLIKREPSMRASGLPVWRESLVWVCTEGFNLPKRDALPQVVSPEPCVYRKRATQALRKSRRTWRIAYTCGSLAGAQAAVKAGLGVTVLPKNMVPPGLHMIESGELPVLHDTEIALLAIKPMSKPADRLREHIVSCLERPRSNRQKVG